MSTSLKDRTVLVIGRGSGIARAVTMSVREAGGTVVVAGRDEQALAGAYDGITAVRLDLTDEASIAALANRLGQVDHVVSTASARARTRGRQPRRAHRPFAGHRRCRPLRTDQHLHDRRRTRRRRRRTSRPVVGGELGDAVQKC